MPRKIAIIQGHPDPRPERFCRALAEAYAAGAASAGHEVRGIEIATLDFGLLRSKEEHDHGAVPPALADAQQAIGWADHVVIVFPLWLGGMPALLKGFLEQVLRPGFAYRAEGRPARLLKGRSARVVVTMGMPAFAYRMLFGGHGVKQLTGSILRFCGFGPVRTTLVGSIEATGDSGRRRGLDRMRDLGARGR